MNNNMNNDMSNTMAMEFGPQPNKPKKKHPFLKIILAIILGIIIGGGAASYYLICFDNPFAKKEIVKEKTPKKETSETITDDNYLISSLRNRLHNATTPTEELKLYSAKKLQADDIDSEYVNYLMINEAKRQTTGKTDSLTKDELQNALFTIFGEHTSFIVPEEDFGTCPKYTYDAEASEYKTSSTKCDTNSNISLESTIVKAIKSEDQIEIYEAVAFIDNENNKVYKKVDANGEVDDELEDMTKETFLIDRDYKKVNQYKYIFTYNEDTSNYIFESLSLVK